MLNCSGILQLTLDHLIDYNFNLCKFGIPQLSRAVENRTSTDKIDLLVRFKGRLDCFVHDLFLYFTNNVQIFILCDII